MRYTLKFGTFFGIPVRIHFTFPLILVLFGAEAWVRGGWTEALWAVALVLAVFACVVAHEFGHSLQVRRYGITVRDIVLLPIGGMARADQIPERPGQEIIVAISGPLVNFGLAAIFFVILWARRESASPGGEFVANLLWINLVLGIFNLTPAFPMDGGRILRGIFATRMSYPRATRYAKNVGQVIAIIFVVIGFVQSQLIMLPLIAIFIYFGAISEDRMVRAKFSLGHRRVGEFVPANDVVLRAEDKIESAVTVLGTTSSPVVAVTDAASHMAGVARTIDLHEAIQAGRGEEPIAPLVRTNFPLIDADTPAVQAYYLLRSHKAPFAGVVRAEIFVGVVLYRDLAIEVQSTRS